MENNKIINRLIARDPMATIADYQRIRDCLDGKPEPVQIYRRLRKRDIERLRRRPPAQYSNKIRGESI